MVSLPREDNKENAMERNKARRKSMGGGDGERTRTAAVATSPSKTSSKDKKEKRRRRASTGTLSPAAAIDVLGGVSQSELTMIRRLAGNDPAIRKKTMRKLRKWLTALVLKVPEDCEDIHALMEPNMVRVWKALFFCMWMADKPLPQEQLAEQISNLVVIVGMKTNMFLLFFEWFLRTMGREWNWIDRYRLDKFMMLCRRFLRKTLSVIGGKKWDKHVVEGYNKIIREYVFNHRPVGILGDLTVACPLGLQLHYVDIFLEELAKAGGDKIKNTKVLQLLSPFVEEVATSKEERILDAINERIFNHLMRQSDVGIDYQESLMGLDEEDEDEEMEEDEDEDSGAEIEENGVEYDESESNPSKEDDIYEAEDGEGPLDPRAGAVDVVLPQLQLDYSELVEKLTVAGGATDIRKKNRNRLYAVASSFKALVEGKYPLALPEDEGNPRAIPKAELKKATARLLELEEEQCPAAGKNVRKTKKQRRREAKRLQQQEQLDPAEENGQLDDTIGSEDTSAYLNDREMMDNVDDNYASYMEEQMKKGDEDTTEVDTPKKKKKRQRGDESDSKKTQDGPKKKKYKTVIEFEADELKEDEELRVSSGSPQKVSPTQEQEGDAEEIIRLPKNTRNSLTLSRNRPKKKRLSLTFNSEEEEGNKKSPGPPELTPIHKAKNRTPFGGATPSPPVLSPAIKGKRSAHNNLASSLGSSRKINFVLARNLEHEATDYMPSISRSPAIPYDASKTPTSGILKTARAGASNTTPIARKAVGIKSSPRKKALDFF